jgi:transcriptional regulator with XRE-family HTH domain
MSISDEPDLNLQFAQRFKEERSRLGLTQRELARHTSIDRLLIGRYELGKTLPGTEVLIKLNGGGMDVAFLITGKKTVLDREPDLFNRTYQEVKRQAKDSGEVLSSKEHLVRAWTLFNALNSVDSKLIPFLYHA